MSAKSTKAKSRRKSARIPNLSKFKFNFPPRVAAAIEQHCGNSKVSITEDGKTRVTEVCNPMASFIASYLWFNPNAEITVHGTESLTVNAKRARKGGAA